MKRCRKQVFFTRAAAEGAKWAILRKKDRLLVPYQCQKCRLWHLGNSRGTRERNVLRILDNLPENERAS